MDKEQTWSSGRVIERCILLSGLWLVVVLQDSYSLHRSLVVSAGL